ncbi:mediator complex subunit 13 C-terminal-domain-containing protein [Lasiosphaeria ovina]|uniref:Mediator of RNA polymerase II transcription subunit 13 n=1 Tax=Lasiosphaeria ovina TaxID=92902 RepID=A0AAE0NMZ4_9PEZI|nr:mediator complex subunit 13 C-terminal-domain-containing protein [Lasiosphaeria ovina]
MDVGEYDTNTLLINNLSSIAFRIYEPVASHSSTYTFAASDVEDALRSDGHLVYMDVARRGIWCFYLSDKDAPLSLQPEQHGLYVKMEVCGYLLRLVEEGSFEPPSLYRGRSPGANVTNTPNSSSSSASGVEVAFRSTQPTSLPPALTAGTAAVDTKMAPSLASDSKGYNSVPAREIHEFFVTAVLSSLSTSLCHQIGAISLNHRTVLLPPQAFHADDVDTAQASRTSALATFRVYLTTTGSLVISLSVSLLQGLISSAEALRSSLPSPGPIVLAAPLGAFGALQGVVDGYSHLESGFGHSPETHISRARPEPSDRFSQWKSTCIKLLQMRGMSPALLDGCSWLNIHFLQRKPFDQRGDGKRTPLLGSGPTAPWPSVLCFRKPKMEAALGNHFRKLQVGNVAEHTDPLDNAKLWSQGVSEREDTIARRKRERDATMLRETTDADARDHQHNGYSPLNLRRSSNGGGGGMAAGIMYPTPPDGVQQPGLTPSFDGAGVSPGQQPAATAMADIDTVMHHDAPTSDGFADGWHVGDPKREPQGAAFLEGENMFGDLGDNLFEDNELTDADFNFFDEQPLGADVDLSVLPEMGLARDMSASISHAIQGSSRNSGGAETARPNNRPALPEFTKPELKHARSTLAEESRQLSNLESYNMNSTLGIKRHPSPFNPETVYKRIRASTHAPMPPRYPGKNTQPRRGSVFEKVDFDPSLSLVNKRYQERGPYDYTIPALKAQKDKRVERENPLTPGGMLEPVKQRKSLKSLPPSIGLLLAKINGGINGGLESSPARPDDLSESESSWSSEDDNASDMSGDPSSPEKSSVVRRRQDDDVVSMAASFKDLENTSADSPGYGSIDLSRLSIPEVPELSMTRYFADPEPVPLRSPGSDDAFITVAQVLTEQAGSGLLKLAYQRPCAETQEARRCLVNAIRYSVQGLQKALPRTLAGAMECQLRPFIEVQDVPSLGPPNRVPPRPAGQELVRPNIFQIPTPHIEIRRYETQLSVLPSAVSFWETLGLGPSQGPKDIVSICVFPQMEGLQGSALAFVERIRSTYESLKLGVFVALPTVNGIVGGLLPFAADYHQDMVSPGANTPRDASAATENMARLAQALAATAITEKNFVVYFVYSAENPRSIVDSCAAFQELFEHYKRVMSERKKPITNELVLQLVPLGHLASETSLVVLFPADYIRLCIETYDRCTLFGGSMPAPAIMLERALPRTVDFKLTSSPSPNLLLENTYIHVAYAQSVDERWVTAAWTDNRGSKQMTASYCLGRRGKPLSRHLTEVVREIWETTLDFISALKVHWRIIVAKCGPMDQQETEFWVGLAKPNGDARANVSLTLVTVDTNPSLQLIPPSVKIPFTAPSVFYTTPVSTPQTSIVSPDQSGVSGGGGNPSTPMGATSGGIGATTPGGENSATEPDVDTTLIDVTETTWGVVVSHRLNNSTSLTDLNPALASGYLIKRGGHRPDDAPVAIEVNVIHNDGNNPRVHESLLRDLLMYFRGLGTLARARGIVERDTDARPWHVAAAEKAVRVLYLLM